jgi:hypothetical protein
VPLDETLIVCIASSRVGAITKKSLSKKKSYTCCAIADETLIICIASSRVGAITMTPTSRGRQVVSLRKSSSKAGTKKATVLPV